ncbi:MAG: TMEM165/GDT1 family protein [Methylococcales bacterium]|nr:TMEM165/GDT1 family protein [Methylococcales bacterium]
MELINTVSDWLARINSLEWSQLATGAGTTFLLIAAAEIGDKSQLVCMTLAARHRKAWPIILAALAAFGLLNLLAVMFGAAIARWLPEFVVAGAVALLFLLFALQSLLFEEEDDDDDGPKLSHHGLFLTTFLMITLAEFGDKTQLAVVALASTFAPVSVWLGATVALTFTSALGVWAGQTVLGRLPIHWLHKISGLLFLALAALAGYQAYTAFDRDEWVNFLTL